MGGAADDYGRSISLSASGNVYVMGNFYSPSITVDSTILANADNTGNTADIFIAKLDTVMTIGINEAANSGNGILVFPNAATNELRIENAEFRIESIDIYDAVGKRILHRSLQKENNALIDISLLSAGIYFVQLRNDK